MKASLNQLICIPIALIMLSAVTLVPAMAYSPLMDSQSNAIKDPLITTAHVNLTILENTATSQKVLIGDTMIETRSAPDHTNAVMTITNRTTMHVDKYEFKVTNNSGVYTTDVYQNGVGQGSFNTNVDPLQPYVYNQGKVQNTAVMSANSNSMSPMTTYKTWDGLTFKTSGVPYPHPDETTYNLDPYQDRILWGSRLAHIQIDQGYSGLLVTLPVVTMVASIITLATAFSVAVFGGLSGAASALAILVGGQALKDERGCIWVWGSYQQITIDLWFIHINLAPGYFKMGSMSFWDFIGMGSP